MCPWSCNTVFVHSVNILPGHLRLGEEGVEASCLSLEFLKLVKIHWTDLVLKLHIMFERNEPYAGPKAERSNWSFQFLAVRLVLQRSRVQIPAREDKQSTHHIVCVCSWLKTLLELNIGIVCESLKVWSCRVLY